MTEFDSADKDDDEYDNQAIPTNPDGLINTGNDGNMTELDSTVKGDDVLLIT